MIFLNYIDYINMALFTEFWRLCRLYFGYIAVLAAILIAVRFLTKVPDYIFRKLLHFVAFTSILPLVFGTEVWWMAVLVEIVFILIIIFVLHAAENLSFYKSLLVEKEKHEVIISFTILFGLMATLMAVYWGIFGPEHKYIAVASIMAWGPGDAAAAIVGKRYGKHLLSGRFIERTKSVEGTVAMGTVSFLCTLATLLAISGLGFGMSLLLSIIIAPIAALVELYTKHGLDTVTVPIVTSIILLLAMFLLHI